MTRAVRLKITDPFVQVQEIKIVPDFYLVNLFIQKKIISIYFKKFYKEKVYQKEGNLMTVKMTFPITDKKARLIIKPITTRSKIYNPYQMTFLSFS